MSKPAKKTVLELAEHITLSGTRFVILFDRVTKDYSVTRDGETCGSRESLAAALSLRNELVSMHLTAQERMAA